MKTFPNRKCQYCSKEYLPSGPCSKFCSVTCRDAANSHKKLIYAVRHSIKKGKLVGVGSGGKCGKSNGAYKNNISFFLNISSIIKHEIGKCERCGKDLFNATKGQWAIHHKDHDRNNNSIHNFELLCRSCHAKEHEAQKAFEGVTTTQRDSITGRYKRIEAPNTSDSDDIV